MFSDQVYLVVMCSPSAENKRRSKHAGKSLNPEWNQTVIYKNIHLEQVLYAVRDTLQVHSDLLAHMRSHAHITSKESHNIILNIVFNHLSAAMLK